MPIGNAELSDWYGNSVGLGTRTKCSYGERDEFVRFLTTPNPSHSIRFVSRRTVRKAVLPAAGLGTRFLPATKASPKEMLPLVDKSLIQYTVEEVVAAGIEDIIVITGRGKRAIEDHFDRSVELEENLKSAGFPQPENYYAAMPFNHRPMGSRCRPEEPQSSCDCVVLAPTAYPQVSVV